MIEILFWLIYLTTPLVTFGLQKVAGEDFNQASIVNVLNWSLYGFSVLGVLPLFYQWDAYRAEIGITDQYIIFLVLLYSSINLICFMIGVNVAIRGFKLKSKLSKGHLRPLNNKQILLMIIYLAICMVTLIEYISHHLFE